MNGPRSREAFVCPFHIATTKLRARMSEPNRLGAAVTTGIGLRRFPAEELAGPLNESAGGLPGHKPSSPAALSTLDAAAATSSAARRFLATAAWRRLPLTWARRRG